jgi:hypothetical protein
MVSIKIQKKETKTDHKFREISGNQVLLYKIPEGRIRFRKRL